VCLQPRRDAGGDSRQSERQTTLATKQRLRRAPARLQRPLTHAHRVASQFDRFGKIGDVYIPRVRAQLTASGSWLGHADQGLGASHRHLPCPRTTPLVSRVASPSCASSTAATQRCAQQRVGQGAVCSWAHRRRWLTAQHRPVGGCSGRAASCAGPASSRGLECGRPAEEL